MSDLLPKIGLNNKGVGAYFPKSALCNSASMVNNDNPVADLHDHLNVVFNQEAPDALITDPADEPHEMGGFLKP